MKFQTNRLRGLPLGKRNRLNSRLRSRFALMDKIETVIVCLALALPFMLMLWALGICKPIEYVTRLRLRTKTKEKDYDNSRGIL